jgi:hypothetical protein
MSGSRVENLLGVKWYDGLVVGSHHLTHSDRRVDALIAQLCQAGLDQPGLLNDDSPNRTPSQLIEIESSEPSPGGLRVRIALTRPFAAVSLSGKFVVGHTSRGGQAGIPDSPFDVVALPQPTGQILVCARQVEADELHIDGRADGDSTVTLRYPGLEGAAVSIDNYIERVVGDYADYVPIGSLDLTSGNPVVDQSYIPPVLKLTTASAFDEGLVTKISAQWETLFRTVSEKVDAAGAAFAQGQGGADLMSRRTDYEALRTLLLCTWGLAKNITGISPTRLLFEAVQPIASWWQYHRGRHFPNVDLESQTSPVAAVSRLARSLSNMTHRDLCAGSSTMLLLTNEFLPGIKDVLAVG